MNKVFSIILAAVMALTVFALPADTFAAKKAPAKVKSSTIKVSVYKGNSLKFSWGAAKLATAYQVQYKVVTNGKTVVKWKTLKKAKKKRYHIYKGTKGNKYTVWIRVRAINGKKYGKWSATKAKAKKITKTIPAFTPKYASFNPSLAQVSDNRSITVQDYFNTQGCAFDTYTGVDGYNFTINSDSKDIALVHFRTDANGSINKLGTLYYKKNNLGHANDGTIYQQGNQKLLFVAISGGSEKSAVDSYGQSIKLAFIDLAEYARQEELLNQLADYDSSPTDVEDPTVHDENPAVNEEASVPNDEAPSSVDTMDTTANLTTNVYGVAINTNGVKMSDTLANSAFSGITYVGKKNVGGTDRQVFVLKDGRTFYAAYLTITNGSPKLTFFDSARINKPVIKYNGKTYAMGIYIFHTAEKRMQQFSVTCCLAESHMQTCSVTLMVISEISKSALRE